MIAGHVGAGLGSPRNLADPYEDEEELVIQHQQQPRPKTSHGNSNMPTSNSAQALSRNAAGEVQIPIQRMDMYDMDVNNNFALHRSHQGSRKKAHGNSNYNLSEHPDSKVAYRLASTERL